MGDALIMHSVEGEGMLQPDDWVKDDEEEAWDSTDTGRERTELGSSLLESMLMRGLMPTPLSVLLLLLLLVLVMLEVDVDVEVEATAV